MKHICKKTNCGKLIDKRGYCAEHAHIEIQQQRESWAVVKARQSKHDADFYNSSEWHKVSRSHRIREPLCRQCKKDGRTTIGTLVHHNPELSILRDKGLNPFIDNYLETMCMACHNRELHKKERIKEVVYAK